METSSCNGIHSLNDDVFLNILEMANGTEKSSYLLNLRCVDHKFNELFQKFNDHKEIYIDLVNASKMQELYDRKEQKDSLLTENKYLEPIARGVVQHNRRDFLETFWNKLDVIKKICNVAGKEGRIDILEEIQNKTDKGMRKKVKENTWPCDYASQAGRLDVMDWLKSNGWSFSAENCMCGAVNLEV